MLRRAAAPAVSAKAECSRGTQFSLCRTRRRPTNFCGLATICRFSSASNEDCEESGFAQTSGFCFWRQDSYKYRPLCNVREKSPTLSSPPPQNAFYDYGTLSNFMTKIFLVSFCQAIDSLKIASVAMGRNNEWMWYTCVHLCVETATMTCQRRDVHSYQTVSILYSIHVAGSGGSSGLA